MGEEKTVWTVWKPGEWHSFLGWGPPPDDAPKLPLVLWMWMREGTHTLLHTHANT